VLFGLTLIAFAVVQVKMPKTATIPVKVITQRTMLACAWYTFFGGGGMMLVVYYIPLWCRCLPFSFSSYLDIHTDKYLVQTTKGVSPVDSGIYTIPLVLSLVVASILSAAVTQRIGYYVPTMVVCPCVLAIGQGLLTTFKPDTGSSHWIAYQFLVGFGLGLGMQASGLAVQATLPKQDVPIGVSINFFAQQLGGSIFVSVGQSVLNGRLMERLSGIPGLDPQTVVDTGATDMHKVVPLEYRPKVAGAYNYAITRIFFVSLALALVQLICALCVEWRSIKPKTESSPEAGNTQTEQKSEDS
jgi:MFS family permease